MMRGGSPPRVVVGSAPCRAISPSASARRCVALRGAALVADREAGTIVAVGCGCVVVGGLVEGDAPVVVVLEDAHPGAAATGGEVGERRVVRGDLRLDLRLRAAVVVEDGQQLGSRHLVEQPPHPDPAVTVDGGVEAAPGEGVGVEVAVGAAGVEHVEEVAAELGGLGVAQTGQVGGEGLVEARSDLAAHVAGEGPQGACRQLEHLGGEPALGVRCGHGGHRGLSRVTSAGGPRHLLQPLRRGGGQTADPAEQLDHRRSADLVEVEPPEGLDHVQQRRVDQAAEHHQVGQRRVPLGGAHRPEQRRGLHHLAQRGLRRGERAGEPAGPGRVARRGHGDDARDHLRHSNACAEHPHSGMIRSS